MTRAGASSVDKGSSATDEGVVTSSSNDNKGLTTLDGGGGVARVVLVLVDGERLTGDGGLINLEESIVGDDTAISGNDGTLLDLENITGDNLGSLDLLQGAVTENDSLEGKSLLELIDDRTSLVFLDETDNSVQKQQTRSKLASESPCICRGSTYPRMTPKSTQSSRPAATIHKSQYHRPIDINGGDREACPHSVRQCETMPFLVGINIQTAAAYWRRSA